MDFTSADVTPRLLMLNLNDMYLFVQAVDRGGFAAAARALDLPKSTVSKRVAELEAELGARLVQRTSRSFTMTDVGRDFHRHASAMLREAEAAESIVRGRLAEPSGEVRITASVPTVQLSLAPILPDLARAHPKLRLVVHATDRFVDLVQEGFDLAIRDHFGPLPDSSLTQRRVGADPVYLVASPHYLDTRGVPVTPADLADHEGLLVTPSASTWSLSSGSGERVAVRPLPRFHADESLTLLEAATHGLGITCLPRKLCRPRIEHGELVRVLPDWVAGHVTTTLLIPHQRGQLPATRAVIEFLVRGLG